MRTEGHRRDRRRLEERRRGSSLRASRVGGVRASASSLPPVAAGAVASGPVLVADGAEKEARLRKLPRKPVKFEGMRDDEIKHAEDDLRRRRPRA